MRRLVLAATVAVAFALPTAPADAMYCGELLADTCQLVCDVALDGRCPR